MSSNKNNRKKSKYSSKTGILYLYLFLVIITYICLGFVFTFSISVLFLSILIVSTIFLIHNYFKNEKEIKRIDKTTQNNESEIKLYNPKYKGDYGLVELKRKNLNFNLSVDQVKKDLSINKDKNSNSSYAVNNAKKESNPDIKKRYNPYKSPFEPINTLAKEKENNVPNTGIVSEQINTDDDFFESTYDEETAIEILDNEITFKDSEEKIIRDLNSELPETFSEAAAISEENMTSDVCNFADIKNEEAYTESDVLEEDSDYEAEALNIVQFRPRVAETDIRQEKGAKLIEEHYEHPPYELLRNDVKEKENSNQLGEQETVSEKLVETLASFGVGAKVINVSTGPSVTRYELQPNPGVKVSKIVGLSDDIALNLAATGVRIEAPIPGKAAVGIEVPNKEVTPVLFGEVIKSREFIQHPSKLAFALGKDVAGRIVIGDVAKMPHLLIAGATGSGKSVCINTLISSILYKAAPSEVKLLLVDPKVVELGIYNGIPHLLIPVVTDPKKAAGALSWAVLEMTNRYKLFAENNARDIRGYNAQMKAKNEQTLPQIVIIIDELADLMLVAPNDVEDCICRLAQMARAAGMHLVIATQRPSVDVITGVIKANIPSRISFAVSSQIDSRTILDMAGAEKLLGRGDMLFNPIGEMKPTRVQGSFITDGEVEALVNYLKSMHSVTYDQDVLEKINTNQHPAQNEANDDDELLPQVVDMVIEYGQASASLIQRKFKVGYSRAARILDQMESWGIVGQAEGSKPRQILITRKEWDELNS